MAQMWMTHQANHARFGIDKFGLLEGPPMRGAQTVVDAATHMFDVDCVAFVVFDDLSADAKLRISSDPLRLNQRFALEDSVCSSARDAGVTTAITDVREEFETAPEADFLGIESMLLSPVFGPETTPLAMLVLMSDERRTWSDADCTGLENLAHLISQELILKASFETLHIMRRQQTPIRVQHLN